MTPEQLATANGIQRQINQAEERLRRLRDRCSTSERVEVDTYGMSDECYRQVWALACTDARMQITDLKAHFAAL